MLGLVQFVFVFAAILMVLIILIQKGKGGGLSGAFGGVSGQTAFGTRTADVLTKFTMGLAIAWILMAMLLVVWMKPRQVGIFAGGQAGQEAPAEAGEPEPGESEEAPAQPAEGEPSSRLPGRDPEDARGVLARAWTRLGVAQHRPA